MMEDVLVKLIPTLPQQKLYLTRRDHWGDLGVDGWIILGCISRRLDVGIWTKWADPGYRQVADACECGNEPLGYVK